ncbi:hypothetical protein RCO48_21695 [Peribacillus frigoritolerans]|nr:hypothetical protein [Peribacillus frigoritolerans]
MQIDWTWRYQNMQYHALLHTPAVHGETIHNALLRECMEEVEVGELLHIREYIGKKPRASFIRFSCSPS